MRLLLILLVIAVVILAALQIDRMRTIWLLDNSSGDYYSDPQKLTNYEATIPAINCTDITDYGNGIKNGTIEVGTPPCNME